MGVREVGQVWGTDGPPHSAFDLPDGHDAGAVVVGVAASAMRPQDTAESWRPVRMCAKARPVGGARLKRTGS